MSRTRQAQPIATARARGATRAPAESADEAGPPAVAGPPEQRRGPRRHPRPDRALVAPFGESAGRNWIPRRWPYLILTMVAATATRQLAVAATIVRIR